MLLPSFEEHQIFHPLCCCLFYESEAELHDLGQNQWVDPKVLRAHVLLNVNVCTHMHSTYLPSYSCKKNFLKKNFFFRRRPCRPSLFSFKLFLEARGERLCSSPLVHAPIAHKGLGEEPSTESCSLSCVAETQSLEPSPISRWLESGAVAGTWTPHSDAGCRCPNYRLNCRSNAPPSGHLCNQNQGMAGWRDQVTGRERLAMRAWIVNIFSHTRKLIILDASFSFCVFELCLLGDKGKSLHGYFPAGQGQITEKGAQARVPPWELRDQAFAFIGPGASAAWGPGWSVFDAFTLWKSINTIW